MLPDLPCQTPDVADGQHLFVHHADEELFHRSGTEFLNDVAHDARRNTALRQRRLIEEDLALDPMAQETTPFKTPEQRAHTRVFERMLRVQGLAYLF
jgi:hypothetical protein